MALESYYGGDMTFKCANCGHNEFQLHHDLLIHYETKPLTEFLPKIGWYDTGENNFAWAMCLKCGKEYEYQTDITQVEENLIKIGALT